MRTAAPNTMPTLRGVTSAPMSTSHFFRNKPLLLSHPRDSLAFYPPLHQNGPHPSYSTDPRPILPPHVCCSPLLSLSHPDEPADRPYSLDLFTSPTCPAEHTTIPFIACLSAPFSEIKEEKERRGRGGYKNKKNQGNNYIAPPPHEPCASGFPALDSVN